MNHSKLLCARRTKAILQGRCLRITLFFFWRLATISEVWGHGMNLFSCHNSSYYLKTFNNMLITEENQISNN